MLYRCGMNRTDRLLAILLAFQAQRELRAEDLAARFEVSVRTIYRDVQALTETGVPIAAMPGTGYRLLDGYFLPPLTFTADEAALLALGGGFVRDRVDPALSGAVQEALRKLISVLPADRRTAVSQWQEEMRFVSFRGHQDTGPLTALRTAIHERRVVHLLYQSRGSDASQWRAVEAISLLHTHTAWCLVAYCRLRQAPRIFRLDRIDQAEPLGERFEMNARHQIGPFIGQDLERHAEARVQVDQSAERWVREQ